MRHKLFAVVVTALVATTSYSHPVPGALHEILTIENLRTPVHPELIAYFDHESPMVAARALIATGRIGNPLDVAAVAAKLTHLSPEVRTAAAFALGLIKDPSAAAALATQLASEPNGRAKGEALMALGRIGRSDDLPLLIKHLNDVDERVQARAAQGLGLALMNAANVQWALPVEAYTRLLTMASGQTVAAMPAAFALGRFKGPMAGLDPVPFELAVTAAKNHEAQAYMIRLAPRFGRDSTRTTVVNLLSQAAPRAAGDAGSRAVAVEVARATSRFEPDQALLAALELALQSKDSQLIVQSLNTIEILGSKALTLKATASAQYSSDSEWIRSNALPALAALATGSERRELLRTAIANGQIETRLAAIRVLPAADDPTAVDDLSKLASDNNLRVAQAALETLGTLDQSSLTSGARDAIVSALLVHDFPIVATAADAVATFNIKPALTNLVTALQAKWTPDEFEARVAILKALGTVGDQSIVSLVEAALGDSNKQVVTAAAATYEALTGTAVRDRIPLNHRVTAETPSLRAIGRALSTRVVLTTTKGVIELAMHGEAPLTATNFIALVQQHFYEGKVFHRVVPHFVVQGGDPRGDGWGGPGYVIRDEVTMWPHGRGTVGIATSGKDTGGCQIFINHGNNLHLDGTYTVFAHVVKGMDVADRLTVGDKILSAVTRP